MKKILLFQVNEHEDLAYYEVEGFIRRHLLKIGNKKILIISALDKKAIINSKDIAEYLGLNLILKHESLNKKVKDLNEALEDMLMLVVSKNYDIMFLVTHYNQLRLFPQFLSKKLFHVKKNLRFESLPGTLTVIDLKSKKTSVYNPNSILN